MDGLTLAEDYQGKEVVKAAWGRWLTDSFDWDWWVTLTFDRMRTGDSDRLYGDRRDGQQRTGGKFAPGSASHTLVGWQQSSASWDRWLSTIADERARDGLREPFWFRGREANPNHRGTHFHALIGGVSDLSRRDAWRSWFEAQGVARIEPYDPRRGAGWYVAKYVVKELGDLSFSPNAGQYRKLETDSDRTDWERGRAVAGDLHPWRVPGD